MRWLPLILLACVLAGCASAPADTSTAGAPEADVQASLWSWVLEDAEHTPPTTALDADAYGLEVGKRDVVVWSAILHPLVDYPDHNVTVRFATEGGIDPVDENAEHRVPFARNVRVQSEFVFVAPGNATVRAFFALPGRTEFIQTVQELHYAVPPPAAAPNAD